MIDIGRGLVLDLVPKVPIVKSEEAITITEEDQGLALAPHHTDEGTEVVSHELALDQFDLKLGRDFTLYSQTV